jgi:hypothetical protein
MTCTPSPTLWVNLVKENGMENKRNAHRFLEGKHDGNIQEKPKIEWRILLLGETRRGGGV